MTEYLIATTLSEALALLAQHGGDAQVIAGGTDVLPDLRAGKKRPETLVDITRIPGLNQVVVNSDSVTVGAATTFSALHAHPFIQERVPALAEAARSVGALGIQAVATWAGNLVQAMPAADGAVVALALEAEALVWNAGGAPGEWRAVDSLILGPGHSAVDPTRQIISHLRFPLPAAAWGAAWRRIGRRASLVLPILNCAVKVILQGDLIQRAVIALAPVAPRPCRASRAELLLAGRPPSDALFAEVGRMAQQESQPRSSIMRASREYRMAIIPALVRDALWTATHRALRSVKDPDFAAD